MKKRRRSIDSTSMSGRDADGNISTMLPRRGRWPGLLSSSAPIPFCIILFGRLRAVQVSKVSFGRSRASRHENWCYVDWETGRRKRIDGLLSGETGPPKRERKMRLRRVVGRFWPIKAPSNPDLDDRDKQLSKPTLGTGGTSYSNQRGSSTQAYLNRDAGCGLTPWRWSGQNSVCVDLSNQLPLSPDDHTLV